MSDTSSQSDPEGEVTFVEIDYAPETPDPGRVFRSMAKLIDALHQLDLDLARSVNTQIEPVIFLESVEAGSIRTWLRTALLQIDDDALRNLDWKPLIGQYLVRAKHYALRWLEEHPTIHKREEISALQDELVALAPEIEPGGVLFIQPIPSHILLNDVRLIGEGVAELNPSDRALYGSIVEQTPISREIGLSPEQIEELLTEEVVVGENELVLLIKRPDYLGASRWEFRLNDHNIEAKILDADWLERFQAGEIALRAGAALRVRVRTEVFRGVDGQVITTRYQILKVLGVQDGEADEQGQLVPAE